MNEELVPMLVSIRAVVEAAEGMRRLGISPALNEALADLTPDSRKLLWLDEKK